MKSDIIIELDLRADGLTITAKNVDRVIRQLERSFDRSSRSIKRMENSVRGVLPTLTRMVTTLGLARHAMLNLHAVTSGWVIGIINANAELERMEMLLRGMSKSTTTEGAIREAAKDMEYLIEMARTAPFSLKEMGNTMVKLKSVGIDPAKGGMRALTDAVANFGGTDQILHRATVAIQQMAGKGVISMEELRQQLGEAVPNAMMLMARSIGVSVKELVDQISKGTVQAKPALNRLFIEFELAMGGASERMMQTWVGLTQRMKVSWSLLLKRIGDAGMFDEAKAAMRDLIDALDSDSVHVFAQDLGEALTSVIEGLRGVLTWVQDNITTIQQYGKVAVEVLGAMIAGTIVTKTVVAFAALNRAVLALAAPLVMAGAKTLVFATGVQASVVAAGGMRLAIAGAAASIGPFLANIAKGIFTFKGWKAAISGVVTVIKFLATRLVAFAGPIGLAVAGIVMFKDSIPGLNDLIDKLITHLKGAAEWIFNIGVSAEDAADKIIASAGKAASVQNIKAMTERLDEMNLAVGELVRKKQALEASDGGTFGWTPGAQREKAELIAEIEQEITDMLKEQTAERLKLEEALALGTVQVAERAANDTIREGQRTLDARLEQIRNESRARLNELETQLQSGEISQDDYWAERAKSIKELYIPMLDVVQEEMTAVIAQIMAADDADLLMGLHDRLELLQDDAERFRYALKAALEVQTEVNEADYKGKSKGAGQQQNAFQKYFDKMNGDILELRANIAGLDGTWAEFQYHADKGKFKGLVSQEERANVKTMISDYERLKEQYSAIKNQRAELSAATERFADIESDLNVRIGQMYETMDKGYTTTSSAMRSLEVMRQKLLNMKPASADAADGIKVLTDQIDALIAKQSILDDFENAKKKAAKFARDIAAEAGLVESRMNVARNRGGITEVEYMQERQRFAKDYISLLEREIVLMKEAGASESEINRVRAEIIDLSEDLTLVADTINEKIGGAFDTAFSDIVDGTKSFKDIMNNLFDDIFNEINDMVVKDLSGIFQREILGRGSESGGLGGIVSGLFDFGRGGKTGGSISSAQGLTGKTSCGVEFNAAATTLGQITSSFPNLLNSSTANLTDAQTAFNTDFASNLDLFSSDFAGSVTDFTTSFAQTSDSLWSALSTLITSSFSSGAGSGFGDLLGGVGDLFGGASGGSVGGGDVSAALFGNLFGFRRGGIMSNLGALPLNRYANGGVANTPQLSYFGEGNTPEAYVPLPDGRSIPVKGGGRSVEKFEMHIHGVKDARSFRESEPNIWSNARKRLNRSAGVDN